MTSSFEFHTYPARLSDAERDRALRSLRDGAALGRLSHDTFIRRMELALAARRSEELAVLTADLPGPSKPPSRGPVGCSAGSGRVSAVSSAAAGLGRREAAQAAAARTRQRPPCGSAATPATGCGSATRRSPGRTPSSSLQGGVWVLRDLGSTNGTTVNGRRVTGSAVVRDGDQIGFGRMTFRLSAS